MEPVKEFIVGKVGEFVLSKLLESLYDRLAVPKFWEYLIRGEEEGLKANLDNWRQKLKDIQKMLDAAEERQYSDPAVKEWLNDLKHLVYDVDDIVDELATKASTAAENQARPRKLRKLNILGASSSTHQIDSTLLSKIKEVTDQFNGIVTRKEKLNLKETADERSHGKTDVRAPTSVLTEPEHHVYGRDKDKMAIVDLLVGEKYCSDAQLSVIPILGMGGIGKTTLAQLVYNDEAIQKSFDLKAWACVSQDFDVDRVTKRILQPLTSDDCGGKDRNWLQVKLKEKLQGKKFLVVLDDLWNDDYDNWIILRAPFLVGTPGSKIIITTRNLKVSSMAGTAKAHYLPLLSDDDCFSIFTRHALGASNSHSNLQDIGKKIVERCKGLPLAARTLGGLLRTKKEERNEWEAVLKSKLWDIPEARSGIVPALMLSYHHLPSHLKRCFMYCSILPEDYQFEEQQLVLLWMAEGLIQPPEGDKLQMEDLGSEYFHDLLSRSFFQQSSTKKFVMHDLGSEYFFQQSSTKKFVMHDLIKDLAQRVAGDICFRMEDEIWGGKKKRFPEKVRHSSYLGGYYDIAKKFEPFFELKCLRTFLPLKLPDRGYCYLAQNVPIQLLSKLKRLRALSLSGYCIVELPDSIGDLKHLRYFDLSYTKIRGLPESTTTLCNLQTMILEGCSCLKKLPSNLGNLVNLRHLNILNANKLEGMPPQIGKLTHLQTLSNLIVGKDSCFTLRELGSLLHLRGTLIISQLENATKHRDASDVKLIDKTNLTTLCLEWSVNKDDSEESEFDVLSMLQPHNDLKELTIRGYGGTKFPTWFGHSLLHMVLLRIKNCKKCTSLPPVGQLPSLKHLFIEGMASVKEVGVEFYGFSCSQPFESLVTLHFKDMVEWEKWSPIGEFPCLRKLSISNCPKLLGKLPNHFPSLGKVVIERCEQLVISISSFPKDCKLQIEGSKGTMCNGKVDFSSLKLSSLSTISEFTPPPTEGLLLKGLTRVEDLAFENCEDLTPLWSNNVGLLQPLPNLRVLKFDNCSKLVSLAAEKANEQPQSDLPSTLREIHISRCNALESLPKAVIYNDTCLEYIKIGGCDSLTHIARGQLPPTLKRLYITNCKNMRILVDEDDANRCSSSTSLVELPATLQQLDIKFCGKLVSIAKSEELPASLQRLDITFCGQLESIAKSFHHNSSLEQIIIWECKNLKSLPTGIHTLSHLDSIWIYNCPSLASFPDGGLLPCNLRELMIIGNKMALPNCIHNLTSLQKLEIWGRNSPNVVSVVSSFSEEGFPANLTSLKIEDCNFTEALLEWGLHRLTSLKELDIRGGCPNVESFPEKMLPASLTILTIKGFPNLIYMSSLQNLTSLEELDIDHCENLTSFPEDGLPPSLQQLCIFKCPLLKEHCKKYQGREWSKIAHIPYVKIDLRFIYDPEDEYQ